MFAEWCEQEDPVKLQTIVSPLLMVCALVLVIPAFADETPESADSRAGAPISIHAARFDISQPLAELPAAQKVHGGETWERHEHTVPEGINDLPPDWNGQWGVRHSPHVHQTSLGDRGSTPTPTVNVEGLGKGFPNYNFYWAPPDTTGAAGPDKYIQWVNSHYAVFEKDGTVVDLPGNDFVAGSSLWSGFGGACESDNDGDPIVLYDNASDRWMMSQLAVSSNWGSGPYSECVAISVTGDPLGSWYRYEYLWPSNYLNDCPKFGVWPDGYYLTVNQFNAAVNSWRGAGVAVFERAKMLTGDPSATIQYWNLGVNWGSLIPADLDGTNEPPNGAPNYLFSAHNGSTDYIDIWEVSVDWDTPANSTCGDAGNDPNSSIAVTNYATATGVTQPGGVALDTLSDRLMHRAGYRNFGDHESIVMVHSVNNPTLMRWYEIRDPGGTPVLYQEGSYQPDTSERWMGAIAMDQKGNITMGYSVSDASISPSIRLAGRLTDDPPGVMTIGEIEAATGSGYQTGYTRWGDYSTMSVDPADDCTFWYTGEYVDSVGNLVWQTRITAVTLPGCNTDLFSDGFEGGDESAWSTSVP